MLGWSISASACRSASKRATTCGVSMPGLMTLRATLRRTGSLLLGHEDDAHAAFADLLQQLVRPDAAAGPFVKRGSSTVDRAAPGADPENRRRHRVRPAELQPVAAARHRQPRFSPVPGEHRSLAQREYSLDAASIRGIDDRGLVLRSVICRLTRSCRSTSRCPSTSQRSLAQGVVKPGRA